MPHHQANSLGDIAGRVRRSRAMARALRRSGASHPGELDPGQGPVEPGWTTAVATIRPLGRGRYRRLGWAPGEVHLLRTDLRVEPAEDRAATRRSLLYVAHHTDTHVCDAQAPARLEGGEVYGWLNPGSDGGHRPQETCTAQVLDRAVAATNALAVSPLTGARMDYALFTGDNTDNRTAGEVRWWLDVLDGRPVTPNTGAPGRYEGLQRSGWRAVWHPDREGWDRRQQAGYPHLPGFLDAAVAPFEPAGLQVPWLAVFGNHDRLFLGTFGPARGVRVDLVEPMLAASGLKPNSARGMIRAVLEATRYGPDRLRWERSARRRSGVQRVTPDPEARRALAVDEYLAQVLASGREDAPAEFRGAGPAGHGFTPLDLVEHRTWWSRPVGDHVQLVGLDTCNHTAGDGGGIGPRQLAWLEDELARCHTSWRDRSGREVHGPGPDRLVVLVAHHATWTIDNTREDGFDPGPRTTGDGLVELVDRFPNVVLWLNGHTHEHRIVAHRRSGGRGGWWEVNTGSGIDFGQQGRTVELLDNGDGTLSIVSTVVDHAAPPMVPYRSGTGWTAEELASMSRELAANDDQWIDPWSLLGRPEDRNVELVVSAPFPVR